MKCPYCGVEMEKGVIQSARQIFWSYHKNNLIFSPNEDKDDVVIAPFGWNSSEA